MKNVIVVSELNPEMLKDGEMWLVIGPFCWGRSPSLPLALEKAASNISFGGGSFTAQVIPKGELHMDDFDGSYRVEGWTEEQRQRGKDTRRVVAVTKTAAAKWGKEAGDLVKAHRRALKEEAKP